MKRAILSDIHANLDALQAVLSDASSQGVTEYYCLGDIVGYGPNPGECLDIAMGFDACLLGNHDMASLCVPEGFNSSAARAILWTRQALRFDAPYGEVGANFSGPIPAATLSSTATPAADLETSNRRREFLDGLPRVIREGDSLYVHGSPRNPLSEYVFPNDVDDSSEMSRLFALVPQYCFQGHTHVPGVFVQSGQFYSPQQLPDGYQLGEAKIMVNVGSVGQPRDHDPRACYVIQEDSVVTFRRVTYDVNSTVAKIHATIGLDEFQGDRLLEGK